jgi:hypothetical protein
MDPMKLHQWPYLIYSADETGRKPTYSSGNQKLLPVEGSETHSASQGENVEPVTIVFCMNASGSSRILPAVLWRESRDGFKFEKNRVVGAYIP